ncbi:Na+/H+ antiporter subunit E [Devosia sp.]|jgi:multicomponent K+:H+ antiporter subunit E|uniref:Na+/H+ antiporter subunit E n=1 Tax=Devosia sp. TaxID=1871048 RepID=UPI001AC27A02|nr:Na+/H+ antiporter subunit E [Devosia sp.]MBN9334796.1 Na+/H+ antiporter subunit E [Devosia sp.]
MRRLLPHPILACFLLVLWLVLQQSAGFGHILLGSIIAIAVSAAATAVIPDQVIVKRPYKLLVLFAVAGLDVIRSNLAVMSVLFHPRPKPTAGFIEMELTLTNSFALAILACILTATPGSAWLEYDRERSTVLIHVFDVVDEDAWVATVKRRYETLLLEIFE